MKKILDFPKLRQTYDYDCGAKVLQGVFDYYGLDVREDVLMKLAKTNRNDGTAIRGLKKVLRYFGFRYIDESMSIEGVKSWIDKKIPVVIVLQAWADKKEVDWKKDWKDGHYVVAIGYDNRKIYFEDPSSGRRTFLTYKEFEERWHDRDTIWRKVVNWGMAVYRPVRSKKVRKWFCIDFWNRKYKPGFYYNKPLHMD